MQEEVDNDIDVVEEDDVLGRRRRRRTVVAEPWLGAVCCCGLLFLGLIIILIALAINGFGSSSTAPGTETPTSFANVQHFSGLAKVKGLPKYFSQAVAETQCTGFLNLPESQQPQFGTRGCQTGGQGTCAGSGACRGALVPADSVSTDDQIEFECAVNTTTCPARDDSRQCTCTVNGFTGRSCARNTTPNAATPHVVAFQCVEPQVCPFFGDIALSRQPLAQNSSNCAQLLGTPELTGTCQSVSNSPGASCRTQVQEAGTNTTTPPNAFFCDAVAACPSVGATCHCFENACTRCNNAQCTSTTQFFCAAESQVVGGHAATLTLSTVALLAAVALW